MRYSEAKKLAPKEFKRLSGVDPETFAKMLEIVKKHQENKKVSGRPSKLSLENQILMTLEYLREYRRYFHIGKTWGVYESTAFRIVQKIENILIKSGIFKLPGKKKLIDSDRQLKTIVIDVTESPIERPKKSRKSSTQARRKITHSSLK